MRTSLRIVLSLVVALSLLAAPVPARGTPTWPAGTRPVPGPVLTRFDAPDTPWSAGHRGVDLGGTPGQAVVAAADGIVTYAGVLAGRGVVVVAHGEVRTTYEPLVASVTVGDVVTRGRVVGRLVAGHASCPGTACLHWGLLDGDTYRDPMLLLTGTIRLLPASAAPVFAEPNGQPGTASVVGSGAAPVRPVAGTVTSPYGMRRHPLTGAWKLHDGMDLAAPCGTPIRAAASGTVVGLSTTTAYGNRLVLDHDAARSGHLLTAYGHAERFVVTAGTHVSAGQVIGSVGRTGQATGCHVHVQTWLDGRLVDPMTVIS